MNAAPHLPALLAAGETRLSAEQIYPRLFDAILEQRLPPGSLLPEQALGHAFGVSRTVIRRVLGRLSAQQVVVQRPATLRIWPCPPRSRPGVWPKPR